MTTLTDVSVHHLMIDIGRRARTAARRLARATTQEKGGGAQGHGCGGTHPPSRHPEGQRR